MDIIQSLKLTLRIGNQALIGGFKTINNLSLAISQKLVEWNGGKE
jgi:hypothetical protein